MNEIREATRVRCIEEQEDARSNARIAQRHLGRAQEYQNFDCLVRAAEFQREAAYNHEQAWWRLARLIGVE